MRRPVRGAHGHSTTRAMGTRPRDSRSRRTTLSVVRDSVGGMVSRGRSGAAIALDEAQRAVVDLPSDASGVVVGAPGSGKTATLVARVAALVERGVDPDAILVLTPSRQTATALRDRLALAIGRATSGPAARSVASFAFQLVRA